MGNSYKISNDVNCIKGKITNKMDFIKFIKSLEVISFKVYKGGVEKSIDEKFMEFIKQVILLNKLN